MNKAILILLLIISQLTFSQDKKFSAHIALGANMTILDNGFGPYLGINPAFKIAPIFSLEAQASYMYTYISGSFLSGEKRHLHVSSVVLGFRLYFLKEDKNVRPYISAMAGYNYYSESGGNISTSTFQLGLSGGAFVEFKKKWNVGLSYDTPQHLVLKGAYVF